MLTRIEIDGFKSFDKFEMDFEPFTVIVGPNASGKSNLFDAIKLISLLCNGDVRSAFMGLRGEPEELFRKKGISSSDRIKLAVELLLPPRGVDQFSRQYDLKTQRIRYEVLLAIRRAGDGLVQGIFVEEEFCGRIKKTDDKCHFVSQMKGVTYSGNIGDFLTTEEDEAYGKHFRVRQDGPNKSGNPQRIPAKSAMRTALSSIVSAEFPHLYAVKDFLSQPHFLEISPTEARRENDQFVPRSMSPNASNLAAVLAHIRSETITDDRPDGSIADISSDLARLIPSAKLVRSISSHDKKEYSYEVEMTDGLSFSSRVISDGTLRLLTLITLINDPQRRGLLCFEEPENGIHEARIPELIKLLRESTEFVLEDYFQVIMNTHSPVVMQNLRDREIAVADVVNRVESGQSSRSTRVRRGIAEIGDLIDPERHLTRFEVEELLRRSLGAA